MNNTHATEGKLTLGTKVGFGIGDLGGNLFFTIIGFYLLVYLTDVVQLAAGLAGLALMIGKIWDAITDPIMGFVSDRTQTRLGRRRPYLLAGSITLFVFMTVMFTNPQIANQTWLFVYVTALYCMLNTAYTIVFVPYGSLTPELTPDFDERTNLNGYRMSFAVVGTFVGAAVFLPLTNLVDSPRLGWSIAGGAMGAVMMTTFLITFFSVREGSYHPVARQNGVFRSYLSVLKMKPFLTALLPWSFHITGVNVIQASLIYYFREIYGNEGAFQIALPILLASAIIFIPVWVRISRSIGKKWSYNIGMGMFAVSILVFFFLGHRTPISFAYIIMGIAGIGFATQYVMPFSIIPDVVEYDFAEHGVRREGVFYGMWTFVSKLGQAVGIGLSGWVLAWFGYRPPVDGVRVEQTPLAELGIRLLTGPVPITFFVIGIVILSFYPITRQKYQEILDRIATHPAETSGQ